MGDIGEFEEVRYSLSKKEEYKDFYYRINILIGYFADKGKLTYTGNVLDTAEILFEKQLISEKLYRKLEDIYNQDSNDFHSLLSLEEIIETYHHLAREYFNFNEIN